MPDDPTIHSLANKVTKLEGTVKTHEAETKAKVFEYQLENRTVWQAIQADMVKRDADQAKRDADYRADHQAAISALSEKMARRENRLLIALIAVVGIATAILGLMIQLT
ncbi:MAG: hypothetical protein GDA55_01125 [Cellvibrionales bacterium]|nr:hypothetical protein [Cellvibrionales bacterium]